MAVQSVQDKPRSAHPVCPFDFILIAVESFVGLIAFYFYVSKWKKSRNVWVFIKKQTKQVQTGGGNVSYKLWVEIRF